MTGAPTEAVSVRGEFRRVVGDFARFLRETGHPDCAAASASLDGCVADAEDGLEEAARRALPLCEGTAPAGLSPPQREEHRERSDHAAAICRSLLGAG